MDTYHQLTRTPQNQTKPTRGNFGLGTTPPYARTHNWLKRGLFVCLFGLVIEGSFTMPALAVWYGWPDQPV